MKNLSTLFFALITIFLCSSCKQLSDLSVTKRHYREGYYIDYRSDKTENRAYRASGDYNKNSDKEQFLMVDGDSPVKPSSMHGHEQLTSLPKAARTIKKAPVISSRLPENKTLTHLPDRSLQKEILPADTKVPVVKVEKIKADDGGRSGYLIWTLILILLVLWLLSLLTGGWGLGGLIYIFLVVALVLLLLRLLSVL